MANYDFGLIFNNLFDSKTFIAALISFFIVLLHSLKNFLDSSHINQSIKDSKSNQLITLLNDGNLNKKHTLLVELAFQRCFSYVLPSEEIFHVLNSKKPLLAIQHLKRCRHLLDYKNNAYSLDDFTFYVVNSKSSNILYRIGSIFSLFLGTYMLLNSVWFIKIFGLTLLGILLLNGIEKSEQKAAVWIVNKEYGPC